MTPSNPDLDPGTQPRTQAQAPGPGGAGIGTGTQDPPTVECLLLAVAHHWSIRETYERQVELMERFFDQEQMKTALVKL